MEFVIKTLVDITQTNAKRNDDKKEYRQQQNFLTVLQTISLRANPDITQKPIKQELDVSKLLFGSNFKGLHTVWSLNFNIPYEGAVTIESLKDDFELVPFINNLDSTATFKHNVFRSKNKLIKNVYFEIVKTQ